MTKKYWIQVIVCFLVILIGSVLGVYYYQEYISPESFTIGTISNGTYKELAIKDYLSDDTVLFSQNINDVSFSIDEGTATYDYNFDATEFNGLEKSYLIYVNNYIINDITTNAGTIFGTYKINFQDVDNETLCSSNISISFTFRSLTSVLRVSLPASDIGYLLNYFKSDNFIITLAESPFDFGEKDGEIDEKVQQIIDLTNQIAGLNEDIVELQGEIADKVQEIADLNDDLANKDEIIAGLQNDIEELQAQVQQLQGNLSEKTQQLEELQAEYDQLEDDYGELDDEYVALGDLYDQALATIESLQSQVLELEQQVTYYEELLEAYQNSEKLIVTFTVDDFAYEVQLVDENEYVTKPETDPTKEGYSFEFWSLNGATEFNFSTTPITADTTIVAVFSKLHTVTFMYEDEEYTTQTVKHGEKLTDVEVASTTYKVFWGWLLNNKRVDFETHVVTEDEILYAGIDYYYDVIFKDGDDIIFRDVVLENTYAPVAAGRAHFDYDFVGWSLNGIDEVDVSSIPITENTTFIQVNEKLSAGLYNSARTEKIMTWQELLNNNYFSVQNGQLRKGSNIQNLNGYLVLDDSVTELYNRPFYNCANLTGIDTNNVEEINVSEFYNCSSLTTIIFGQGCTFISSAYRGDEYSSTTNITTICYESQNGYEGHVNNTANQNLTNIYVLQTLVDDFNNADITTNYTYCVPDMEYYRYFN